MLDATFGLTPHGVIAIDPMPEVDNGALRKSSRADLVLLCLAVSLLVPIEPATF
jgi:hypothetical protein